MSSISPAFDWGKEDGLEGKSEFTGYDYFAGANLQEYFEGHAVGVALRQRLQGVVLAEVRRLAGGSDAKYAPFSDPALSQVNGRMEKEPGYFESTQPWAY